MKKNNLVIWIFVLTMIIFLITLYINFFMFLEKKEIIATLRIGDTPGFDANTTALTFGTITKKTSSSRSLNIENDYDFPIKAEFKVKGNISEFLVFEEVVYFDIGENKSIRISTIIPVDEEYGNYFGTMIVVMKRDF